MNYKKVLFWLTLVHFTIIELIYYTVAAGELLTLSLPECRSLSGLNWLDDKVSHRIR